MSTELADGGVGLVAGVDNPNRSAACCYNKKVSFYISTLTTNSNII